MNDLEKKVLDINYVKFTRRDFIRMGGTRLAAIAGVLFGVKLAIPERVFAGEPPQGTPKPTIYKEWSGSTSRIHADGLQTPQPGGRLKETPKPVRVPTPSRPAGTPRPR